MIYLTGDTHIPIDIDKLSRKSFPEQKQLTRDDFIIVLGDFGLLWQEDKTYHYWLDILSAKRYTLLFVDGNHENFDWLNSLPVESWHGGRVHRVAENILHLMRGEVFEIGGNTFFTLGGAVSHDRIYRTEGIKALQAINDTIQYKDWYFGHWHMDFDHNQYHAMYNRVLRLK